MGKDLKYQSKRTLSLPPFAGTPKSELTVEQILIKKKNKKQETGAY